MAHLPFAVHGRMTIPGTSWRHPDADLQHAMFNHCPNTMRHGRFDATTMRLSHWLVDFLRRADLAT